uniref:Uncharacterized protein n=1 Tax=Nelumbo nucifera TaxID=4432 RepID=A0A822ZKN1_NELNU|nr:TPA_asm: hypothetical protein HUJ06_003952 [Nelumbo nucifera]
MGDALAKQGINRDQLYWGLFIGTRLLYVIKEKESLSYVASVCISWQCGRPEIRGREEKRREEEEKRRRREEKRRRREEKRGEKREGFAM